MTVVFVIILIIAALLLIAAFTKKDYGVDREIIIHKPRQVVFDYLRLLKNHDNFTKWAKMDPNMKKEYRGIDGTVGFVSAWDSDNKNVGKGEQEIKAIREGERLGYTLHFIKPFEGLANAYLILDPVNAGETKVTWGFDSRMKYPMNLMLLFMNMEKMIGNDFEENLRNLKTILENQP